ncbi:HxlR family transcriptional regulator [Synergistales bacterium]|nr:HxlR family transcriptional regulator [Synergistales bacterium]
MNKKCPIEATVALINGKWKLLILKALSQGAVRFGALEKAISSVSAKVLTQQLREMESDGLITRKIFPEVPPRVEYSLDTMGISLFSIFVALREWGMEEIKNGEVECSNCAECQPAKNQF